MALLHGLGRLAPQLGLRLVAHGVDHGLRAEAAAELELAGRLARELEVPFDTTRVVVAKGSNLQARAREARYDALRKEAHRVGARLIATAHTADDRAETVLLRLLRGAGPNGLGVLTARDADRARPLIRATRADVLAHLARHHVAFAEDPSNRDPRFLRVRVRREVLPLLRELSPQIVEHLCRLADACAALEGPDPVLRELNAAQRAAVLRAERLGRRGVLLRLAGGRDVEVGLARGGGRALPAGGRREGA